MQILLLLQTGDSRYPKADSQIMILK